MLARSAAETHDELCTCQKHILLQAAGCKLYKKCTCCKAAQVVLVTLCLDLIPLYICKILYLMQVTVQYQMSLQLLRYVHMIDLLTQMCMHAG